MIFKVSSLVSLLATAIAVADLTAANLIFNGGFEAYEAAYERSPCFGTSHINCFRSEPNYITPWNVTSPQKTYFFYRHDILNLGMVPLASAGKWAVSLNGKGPVTIGQKVSLLKGITYKVSFSAAGNKEYCPTVSKMSGFVELDGVRKPFSFTPSKSWYSLSFNFVPNKKGLGLLQIGSTTPGSDNCGPIIDNIRLTN
jgi:hypothetical protein